jgi:predicted metal-dependent hydrolase
VTFTYTIRSSSRTRAIRITVYRDGVVVVTKPTRLSDERVGIFVAQKTAWIESKIEHFSSKPVKLLAHYGAKEFKLYKTEAEHIARALVMRLNQHYGYNIGRIAIRNQKTRWGSCSGKKNLNFNYKSMFLPPELQAYLVVHELCHLREMNHSKRFWDLVAQQVPNYQVLRRELRKY